MQQPEIVQEQKENIVVKASVEVKAENMAKHEVKENPFVIKDDTKNEDKSFVDTTVDTNTLDEMSLETEDLLKNHPWSMAMDQHLHKALEVNLDVLVDDALLETILKNEERNVNENIGHIGTQNYDIDMKII